MASAAMNYKVGPHSRNKRSAAAHCLVVALLASATAGVTCEPSRGHPVEVRQGECATCHMPEFKAATTPIHVGRFPLSCEDCHTESDWQPSSFEHDWPLEGAHADAQCAGCHLGDPPVYEGTATDCLGCHADDRARATDPDHAAFAADCASCHTTIAWQPASFDHQWPLEGAHQSATCASCHGDPPTYSGTATDCIGCHADDRAVARDPDHAAFSTACADCHTTVAWQPASFDHLWPLEGAHASATCGSCHLGNPPVYAGTATDCVGCHRADYDASPYPGHSAFPTTCQSCHSTRGWTPASGGQHPEGQFPITSGAHKVVECMNCHNATLGPNGRGNADCVGCHTGEHSRARMDAKHVEESGYPGPNAAAPNFCLDCHPSGGGN